MKYFYILLFISSISAIIFFKILPNETGYTSSETTTISDNRNFSEESRKGQKALNKPSEKQQATPPSANIHVIPDCTYNCMAELATRLKRGDSLKPIEVEMLTSDTERLSHYLTAHPTLVENFALQLASVVDDDGLEAISYILHFVPADNITKIASPLTYSADHIERRAGIVLLEQAHRNGFEYDTEMQRSEITAPLERLVKVEDNVNNRILAYEVIANQSWQNINQEIVPRLSEMMGEKYAPEIRGRAYKIMAIISDNGTEFEKEVSSALMSETSTLQRSALIAIENRAIFARRDNNERIAKLEPFRKPLEELVSSGEQDVATIHKAKRLLKTYYQD